MKFVYFAKFGYDDRTAKFIPSRFRIHQYINN